jgi:hypothetical protein
MDIFGIPLTVIGPVIILCVLIYAFRNQILTQINKYYRQYKEQKKVDELYARLDRNAEGKFRQKDLMKDVKRMEKVKGRSK